MRTAEARVNLWRRTSSSLPDSQQELSGRIESDQMVGFEGLFGDHRWCMCKWVRVRYHVTVGGRICVKGKQRENWGIWR